MQKHKTYHSRFAQSLLDHFKVHVRVVLNPRQNYVELPLKTYHRFAMAPATFGTDSYALISLSLSLSPSLLESMAL